MVPGQVVAPLAAGAVDPVVPAPQWSERVFDPNKRGGVDDTADVISQASWTKLSTTSARLVWSIAFCALAPTL